MRTWLAPSIETQKWPGYPTGSLVLKSIVKHWLIFNLLEKPLGPYQATCFSAFPINRQSEDPSYIPTQAHAGSRRGWCWNVTITILRKVLLYLDFQGALTQSFSWCKSRSQVGRSYQLDLKETSPRLATKFRSHKICGENMANWTRIAYMATPHVCSA